MFCEFVRHGNRKILFDILGPCDIVETEDIIFGIQYSLVFLSHNSRNMIRIRAQYKPADQSVLFR